VAAAVAAVAVVAAAAAAAVAEVAAVAAAAVAEVAAVAAAVAAVAAAVAAAEVAAVGVAAVGVADCQLQLLSLCPTEESDNLATLPWLSVPKWLRSCHKKARARKTELETRKLPSEDMSKTYR
jgi:hypothetical protein